MACTKRAGSGDGPGGSRATWTQPERVRFREKAKQIEPIREPDSTFSTKTEPVVEAGAGIEPANSGFADRDLTTWLPRQVAEDVNYSGWLPRCQCVGAL